jgi:hypothetical protein
VFLQFCCANGFYFCDKNDMKKHLIYFILVSVFQVFSALSSGGILAQSAQIPPAEISEVPKGITRGRAKALVGGVIGLLSVVAGSVAMIRRSGGKGRERKVAFLSVFLGLISVILGIVHVISTSGGFGTGGGKAGAIVGLVLGSVGAALGGWVLRRSPSDEV